YAKLFAAKGLASQANADGLGTVIRVSAPECDLLIKVHESSSGTSVKVDCSSPQIPSADVGLGSPVVVTNGSLNQRAYGARGRNTGSSYHPKSAADIR